MSYFTDKNYAVPFYTAIKKYIGKHHHKVPFSCEKDAYFRISTRNYKRSAMNKLVLPNMMYYAYTNAIYDWAYNEMISEFLNGTEQYHPYYDENKHLTHLDFVNELCKEINKCLEELDYEIKDYNQFKCDVLYFIYRLSK